MNLPLPVGLSRVPHAPPVRVDVGDGDGRPRHGRAGLILHDSGDFTGGYLGEQGQRVRGEARHQEVQPNRAQTSVKPQRASLYLGLNQYSNRL